MSKWTLEKILACDEIDEGVRFSHGKHKLQLILRKADYGIKFWNREIFSIENYYSPLTDWSEFKFYRYDGTEILPPKDKKKIKFDKWLVAFYPNTTYLVDSNQDAQIIVNGSKHLRLLICENILREIEVEDD